MPRDSTSSQPEGFWQTALDALQWTREGLDGRRVRTILIGPTETQVRAYGPELLSPKHSASVDVVPVSENDTLETICTRVHNLLDPAKAKARGRPVPVAPGTETPLDDPQFLIALSPSSQIVARGLPLPLRSFEGAAPTIALLANLLDTPSDWTWTPRNATVVESASALTAPATRQLVCHMWERGGRARDDCLSSLAYLAGPPVPEGIASVRYPARNRPAGRGGSMFFRQTLYLLDDREAVTPAAPPVLCTLGELYRVGDSCCRHFCRLHRHPVYGFGPGVRRCLALARAADRARERGAQEAVVSTEDDCFAPPWPFPNEWKDGPRERLERDWVDRFRDQDVSMARLADVADIDVCNDHGTFGRSAFDIEIRLDPWSVFHRTTVESVQRHSELAGQPEKHEQPRCPRVRLTTKWDSALLRILSTPTLGELAVATARLVDGRLINTTAFVRSLIVPSPGSSRVTELIKARERYFPWLETLANLVDAAQTAYQDCDSTWSADIGDADMADEIDRVRAACERLRAHARSAPIGGNPLTPSDREFLPIGRVRRRSRAELDPTVKLFRLFDLCEAIIKYDATCHLTMASHWQLEEPLFELRREFAQNGRKEKALALGHWVAIARRCRKGLSQDHGRLNKALTVRVADEFRDNTSKWQAAADEIVRLRNNTRGHGTTPSAAEARQLAADLQKLAHALDASSPHLGLATPFQLQRVDRQRGQLQVQRRLLIGDNPEPVTDTKLASHSSPFANLMVGEAHLEFEETGVVVPLWPLLVCDSEDSSTPGLWLAEKGGPDTVTYRLLTNLGAPATLDEQLRSVRRAEVQHPVLDVLFGAMSDE